MDRKEYLNRLLSFYIYKENIYIINVRDASQINDLISYLNNKLPDFKIPQDNGK